MSSRDNNSLAASSRSQSLICRCTSGSDSLRRSGRGGKSPPRPTRAGSLLSLLPLTPHQETVRQHHTRCMPVEAAPLPALILVPAQQPLGLLVILLHPVPSVRVLHHPLQQRLRTEVAPVVPPLAIRGILADSQPARRRPDDVTRQQRTATKRPRIQPWLPSRQVTDRHDRVAWAATRASARRASPPRRASVTAKSARTATT